MNNNIDILNEIMKPYFDKQDQIKKANAEINTLELRLERLIDNKEQEIDEYIKEAMSSGQNFYSGYEAMIRKDLELAYKEKEEDIRKEIEAAKKFGGFKNVDLRELADIKGNLRRQLISEQKRLNFELRQEQIIFDSTMLALSAFEYEYNDQHQVVNGDEWRKLYERSNRISERIYNIKNSLDKIKEYLNLTELTQEETNALMRSMNPQEQAEYDRRKLDNQANLPEEVEEFDLDIDGTEVQETEEFDLDVDGTEVQETEEFDFDIDGTEVQETEEFDFDIDGTEKEAEEFDFDIDDIEINEEELESSVETNEVPEDLIDSYTSVHTRRAEEGNEIFVESYNDLLKNIYCDVMATVEGINRVKLDPSKIHDDLYYISDKDKEESNYSFKGSVLLNDEEEIQIPNGEYINTNDFMDALNKYYKKNKNTTFVVEEKSRKSFKMNARSIKKLKNKLKDCSIVKLVSDKTITESDVKRVYGQEKIVEDIETKNQFLGEIKTDLPDGDYVSRNELVEALESVFNTKKTKWLKDISSTIKNFFNRRKQEEDVYEDDDFYIDDEETQVVGPEEYEIENVRRR